VRWNLNQRYQRRLTASRPVSDPYVLPNGTLRNRLGITDLAELEAQESRAATARQAILDAKPYFGPFDFTFLCKIHGFLFQDVYDWAGVPRSVGLAKRDVEGPGGRIVAFAPAHMVQQEATRLFASLPSVNDLAAATPGEFALVIGALSGRVEQPASLQRRQRPHSAPLCPTPWTSGWVRCGLGCRDTRANGFDQRTWREGRR
jgi:fido (protein-threonine AMPylation protein)